MPFDQERLRASFEMSRVLQQQARALVEQSRQLCADAQIVRSAAEDVLATVKAGRI